jgi:hypothetical protein
MKRITIAIGALLLGTSAFAWAPSSVPVAQSEKAPIATSDGKAPSATLVAKSNDLPKVDEGSAKIQTASTDTSGNSSLDKGMGGPLEEAAYPPCRPGPGDDHCIQLYEPGVRAALASWTPQADTTLAGEMGGTSTPVAAVEETGMGGPYEPVDASADASADAPGDLAMNGDGVVDAATGETADVELASAAQYTGMGGPLEEIAYPPCRPGPGDDRCIQLYEPGVTGN